MVALRKSRVCYADVIKRSHLSPAFYMPCNLLLLSGQEYTSLAASFHCLEAWTMLQEYSKTCSVYFEQPRTQREYLLYCRALLQDGKVEEAKQLLTVTERYNWPETLRYTDLDDLSQPQPNHSSTMTYVGMTC